MPTYTKLFNSIITSTIWSEDDKTRIIWITMLAMSDKNGEVHASIPGLARVSGMTIAEAEMAIGKLMSPDPYSRTPDNEGRRIAPIDGGWELLNHAKYRMMASKEDAKAATTQRVRRLRERNVTVTPCNASVTVCNASVTQNRDIADTDTDTDKDVRAQARPLCTLAQAKSSAGMAGMTEAEAETWWHARNANGWVKSTASGHPIRIGSFQSDMKQSIGWVREIIAKNGINGKKEWKPNY